MMSVADIFIKAYALFAQRIVRHPVAVGLFRLHSRHWQIDGAFMNDK